jgi:phosphate starvation-inducible protein PhoH and related proteins
MSHKLRFSGNGFSPSSNGKAVRYETKPKRKVLRAKTPNQQAYVEAIERCDVIFCLGPAGTGKTHVAAGMAARLYLDDEVSRIKIVRPAIEAGETLGFLPGDLDDKIHPYLRPILEELQEFLGADELKKMRQGECPAVEFAVLQYLRGANFLGSFVVMDEAQNATRQQMKMFLTRLSHGSKIIVNGDPSQSDLPPSEQGALSHYAALYEDFDEVAVIRMTEADSVRHPLVTKMLEREDDYRANGRP